MRGDRKAEKTRKWYGVPGFPIVFKDAGFVVDVVKTNTAQILRQAEIDDVKSL